MTFTDLEQLTSQLERKYDGNRYDVPPASAARLIANLPPAKNVQYCGVDDSNAAVTEANVIVAIGSNYGQANTPLPTRNIRPFTVDSWLGERKKLDICLTHYRANRQLWVDNFLASSPSLAIPQTYYLAATNLCCWLSTRQWQKLARAYGAGAPAALLVTVRPTSTSVFDHLNDLHAALATQGEPALWVAHGVGSEVVALLRMWFADRGIHNWMVTPNLTAWIGGINVSPTHVIRFSHSGR